MNDAAQIIRNTRKARTDSLRPPTTFGEQKPLPRVVVIAMILAFAVLVIIALSFLAQLNLQQTIGFIIPTGLIVLQLRWLYRRIRGRR